MDCNGFEPSGRARTTEGPGTAPPARRTGANRAWRGRRSSVPYSPSRRLAGPIRGNLFHIHIITVEIHTNISRNTGYKPDARL